MQPFESFQGIMLPRPGEIAPHGGDFEDYLENLRRRYNLSGEVLLIHSPTFNFKTFSSEVAKNHGYYVYPPAGLQCLQAALKGETGIETSILDLNFRMLERIYVSEGPADPSSLNALLKELLDEYFESHDVSVVGVSAGVIVSNVFGEKNHPFLQILDYLKQRDKQIVLAGGVIATNEWKNLLTSKRVHFVFCGESEHRLIFFMKKLLEQATDSSVCGIHFRSGENFCETAGQNDPVNFRWDLVETYKNIPVERYHKVGSLSPFSRMMGPEKRYATIQLNRGCRGRCTFCGVIPFMGKGVRSYPVDAVVKEIRYLAKERGIQHLEWLDDDLLKYRDSLHAVLRQMIEGQLSLSWAANNGLIGSSLDEETIRLMVQSGCIGFRIGVESGNEETLKKIRKPATKQSLKDAAARLRKFPELFVVGCYIIGFEDETYQQILDTFRLCVDLDFSWSGFSVYQIIRDPTNIAEEFVQNYHKISDFVPPKENAKGTITGNDDLNLQKIFTEERDRVHSREVLDEIWFAFNLLSNYINNKNLKPGGRPDSFVRWTRSLQLSHPSNAVISLFLSLGHTLLNQEGMAHPQWDLTQSLLNESVYWQKRFQQYSLDKIAMQRPRNDQEVYRHLREIQEEYHSLLLPL